jgi:hypothetical protein
LLDVEYSGKKTIAYGTTAAVGAGVAIYTTLALCGPAGWAAASFVAWCSVHTAAASCIAVGGAVLATASGYQCGHNWHQVSLRDKGMYTPNLRHDLTQITNANLATTARVEDKTSREAQSDFLYLLAVHLLMQSGSSVSFENLHAEEKEEIYQKLGIQPDLVKDKRYRMGCLKPALEFVCQANQTYLETLKTLGAEG